MELCLNDVEARILGSLIEKEMTTPEYYPLSLNALTNACNQKSNRDPVLALAETDVVRGLDSLRQQGLALQAASDGGRVPKYQHNLAQKLYLEPEELALLCELLLRGPQTIGELRARAERMHPFATLEEVEQVLQSLQEKSPSLALRLPRQPGRKESRFAHLLSGPPQFDEPSGHSPAPEAARLQVEAADRRFVHLEQEVAELRSAVEQLQSELAAFRRQFD